MAAFEPSKSFANLQLKQVEASHVKKNDFVLVEGFPCKIASVLLSKTGKHGSRKAHITGLDVLSKKKYTFVGSGATMLHTFKPEKSELVVIGIEMKDHRLDCLNDVLQTCFVSASEEQCKLAEQLQSNEANETKTVVVKVVRVPKIVNSKAAIPEFELMESVDEIRLN